MHMQSYHVIGRKKEYIHELNFW